MFNLLILLLEFEGNKILFYKIEIFCIYLWNFLISRVFSPVLNIRDYSVRSHDTYKYANNT